MVAPTSQSKASSKRLALGMKADGLAAFGYYRPSLLEFASDVVDAECMASAAKEIPIGTSIPPPSGASRSKNHLLSGVAEIHDLRFRRVYG